MFRSAALRAALLFSAMSCVFCAAQNQKLQEQAWNDLQNRQIEFFNTHQYQSGITTGQQALEFATSVFGQDSPQAMMSLVYIGMNHWAAGDHSKGSDSIIRALRIASRLGPQDPTFIKLRNAASGVLGKSGDELMAMINESVQPDVRMKDCDASSTKPTLCQVWKEYLNKQVVVTGALFNDQFLLEWQSVTQDGARFIPARSFQSLLPARYRGQTATVVAVQLNELKIPTKANALGETIDEDNVVDPYFDLVVRFNDQSYGMLTTYSNMAKMSVSFADDQEALSNLVTKNQSSLIGSTLFACGYSRLYQPDATLEEMTGSAEISK
jgi:hypothetical protein